MRRAVEIISLRLATVILKHPPNPNKISFFAFRPPPPPANRRPEATFHGADCVLETRFDRR